MKFILNWLWPNKKLEQDNRLLKLQTELLTTRLRGLVERCDLLEFENKALKIQMADMEKVSTMQMKEFLQELDLLALEQMKPVGDA